MTLLEAGARFLGRDLGDAAGAPMAADWKVALAAWMKGRCGVSNRWLAEQLRMGAADAVSRYVGEVRKGLRGKAKEEVEGLKEVGL